jgi:DNA-binding GntR family transcriptional regulator
MRAVGRGDDKPGDLGPDEHGESGPPAYNRIANTLANRITSGAYPAGSRLPSGSELCKEFGVSPMTVRRALTILDNRGLISGVKGRGVFARSVELSDSTFRLDSLNGEWLDSSADVRLLSAAMTKADANIAAALNVGVGERVVFIRRLVQYDQTPTMYHREYIRYDPRRPLVESQLQLTTLHPFFDPGQARRIPRGELTVTAMALDREAGEALGQCEGALALCLEHLFMENDGAPVSWGWFLMRADMFRLKAKLGPDQGETRAR